MVGNQDLKCFERWKEEEEREIRNLGGKGESGEFSDPRASSGLSALLLQRGSNQKLKPKTQTNIKPWVNRNWGSQLHSWTLLLTKHKRSKESFPQTPEQQSNKNNQLQKPKIREQSVTKPQKMWTIPHKTQKKCEQSVTKPQKCEQPVTKSRQILWSWKQADTSPKWKVFPQKCHSPNEGFQAQGSPDEGAEDQNQLHVCWKSGRAELAKGNLYRALFSRSNTSDRTYRSMWSCSHIYRSLQGKPAGGRPIAPQKKNIFHWHIQTEGRRSRSQSSDHKNACVLSRVF